MGPDFARGRGTFFIVIGLVFLLLGVGVTAGTYAYATRNGGIYVAYVGKLNKTRKAV